GGCTPLTPHRGRWRPVALQRIRLYPLFLCVVTDPFSNNRGVHPPPLPAVAGLPRLPRTSRGPGRGGQSVPALPQQRLYSERKTYQAIPAPHPFLCALLDCDGGNGMSSGSAKRNLARSCGITFFLASLVSAAALFPPAFAGANRAPASAADDA